MYHNDLMNDSDNLPRLAWACRRGMLELDVLLGNFLNEAYPALTNAEKQAFIQLLGCQDPDIFNWLMGSAVSADPVLASMAARVRQHARLRKVSDSR